MIFWECEAPAEPALAPVLRGRGATWARAGAAIRRLEDSSPDQGWLGRSLALPGSDYPRSGRAYSTQVCIALDKGLGHPQQGDAAGVEHLTGAEQGRSARP